MWLSRTCTLVILVALVSGEKIEDDDASSAFLEAAKSLFTDKDTISGIQGMASAFVQSDAAKQVSEMFTDGKSGGEGVGQIISGFKTLFANPEEHAPSALGSFIEGLVGRDSGSKRMGRSADRQESGFDFETLMSMGNMILGKSGNSDVLMGLLPMVLQTFSGSTGGAGPDGNHDHSGHSWYLPPILEHIHVMWDHFSNSELGQTLWKNSGLSKIVGQMTDPDGHIQYGRILDSFDNPALRRRWIKSLTNFVAEWISHISDPTIQQRYLTTVQFVGNGFLKAQGFPKTAMFDATKPTESIARLANAVAKRHLGMTIDSSQYIRPAVAYIQELMALASEKGFIMSRINARELSNRLSDIINNDLVSPILKSYRAYKWSIKTPQCASQILCTINEKSEEEATESPLRTSLLKISSFPAAWAVSNNLGINFWVLYGAIMEHSGCIQKYPADCTAFHEEEIRATTDNIHNEL